MLSTASWLSAYSISLTKIENVISFGKKLTAKDGIIHTKRKKIKVDI